MGRRFVAFSLPQPLRSRWGSTTRAAAPAATGTVLLATVHNRTSLAASATPAGVALTGVGDSVVVTASETNYTGVFTATSTTPGIAGVSGTSPTFAGGNVRTIIP